MKKNRPVLVIIVIAVLVVIYSISYIWVKNSQSIYLQVETSLKQTDSSFSSLLHIHADKNNTIAFYLTSNNEFSVVTLKKRLNGFTLKSYLNKTPLVLEPHLSWQGNENPDEGIHLLYGNVNNEETTHIIIVSEDNKNAHIINNNELTFWYALMDEKLHLPITIQSFNKDGKKLYETGDVNYWE